MVVRRTFPAHWNSARPRTTWERGCRARMQQHVMIGALRRIDHLDAPPGSAGVAPVRSSTWWSAHCVA